MMKGYSTTKDRVGQRLAVGSQFGARNLIILCAGVRQATAAADAS